MGQANFPQATCEDDLTKFLKKYSFLLTTILKASRRCDNTKDFKLQKIEEKEKKDFLKIN